MTFFSSRLLGQAGLLLATCLPPLAFSCADSGDEQAFDNGADGMGGSQSPTEKVEEVRFLPSDPLLLELRQSQTLTVQVSPPGFHRVSFAVIADADSQDFDGFLETAEALTDEAGIATNVLTAPSRSGVFRVRVTAPGGVDAERSVSVGEQGFAHLVVVPRYGGAREILSWTALAHLGRTCEELENPWGEGDVVAASAKEIRLNSLPVVDTMAVVARAGNFVSGCATVRDLIGDETRTVDVPASDRPLQLTGNSVPVVLGIEQKTDAFIAMLEGAAQLGAGAASDESPGAALLTAMRDQLPSRTPASLFDALLESEEVDAALQEHFARATAPSQTILELLLAAAQRVDGEGALLLTLEFRDHDGLLVLDSALGVRARSSGFLGSSAVSVDIQPGDVLVLGGELKFQPTQFLHAVASGLGDAIAAMDEPPREPEQVIAAAADCSGLAKLLGAYEAETNCDAACQEALCEGAAAQLWQTAGSAGDALTSLQIGITATAKVDTDARPVELLGSWIGSVEGGTLSVSGAVGLPQPPENR